MRQCLHVRLKKSIIAGIGSIAIVLVTTPLPAQAATGSFDYYTYDDDPSTPGHGITNPVNGKCYDFADTASSTHNNTDTSATVFADKGCSGSAAALNSGKSGGSGKSVKVG